MKKAERQKEEHTNEESTPLLGGLLMKRFKMENLLTMVGLKGQGKYKDRER